MSQVTISGAVSGLDTASIINQLVAVQTNQQTLLKSQQSAVQKRSDAFTALATSLASIGSMAAELAKTSAWNGTTVTSSSTAVTASATGTTSAAITFDVTAVASSHALVSTSTLSSTGDRAASGTLTLTRSDGTTRSIGVGTGSLSDVVSAINSSGAGISAAAVRVGPGAYKLQVTATSTGAASQFTLDGLDGFEGTAVLTAGSDAEITVGTDPETAYTATSSTNTFADLVPGLSFTVNAKATGVTVAARVDGSTIADKVSKLVDTTNALLADVAAKTAYSTSTKAGGVFTGEGSVRALQQNILSTVSLADAPGVALTRDGKLSFDREAFLAAFSADPSAVAKSFGSDSSFAPSAQAGTTTATVSGALKSARAGTYAVHVDSLATREQWAAGGTDLTGQTVLLTRGTATLSYTAKEGETADDVAAALNDRAATTGFGVTTSKDASGLVFTADSVGSVAAFTVSVGGTPASRLAAGADVTGSIDGQRAGGLGNVLSLPTGTGGAVGLSVALSTTDADIAASGGDVGSVTFRPGLAQRLSALVNDATADTGSVHTAKDGADAQVKRYQKQIDDWDARLTAYRQTLTTQFTAMETALAKLKTATSALSQLTSSSSSSSSSSASSGN